MEKHGEKIPALFIIREARAEDITALAALHVKTFNETHGLFSKSPTQDIREY